MSVETFNNIKKNHGLHKIIMTISLSNSHIRRVGYFSYLTYRYTLSINFFHFYILFTNNSLIWKEKDMNISNQMLSLYLFLQIDSCLCIILPGSLLMYILCRCSHMQSFKHHHDHATKIWIHLTIHGENLSNLMWRI